MSIMFRCINTLRFFFYFQRYSTKKEITLHSDLNILMNPYEIIDRYQVASMKALLEGVEQDRKKQ